MTTTVTSSDPDLTATVDAVLGRWREAINAGQPAAVAAAFTDDALFQGLRPNYTLGRQGVTDYYASQPPGMTAEFTILQTRALAPTAILAYAQLTFDFPDRPTVTVHLTGAVEQRGDEWLISHYHVSRIG